MKRNSSGLENKGFFFSSLLLFFILLLPSFVYSKEKAEVTDIRYWSSEGQTRVVVYLSQTVEYIQKRLSDPDRLYFDLKNTSTCKEIMNKLSVGDGILKSVRAGQFNKDTVRVVLDLETMENFEVSSFEDPARLVIDVNAWKAVRIIAKKIIVLDPGHGGHDPGAVGPRGLREKDVVLDVALKARALLQKDPSLEVHLTRESDVFIPLEDRTAMARKKDADLFVSIHANASPRRGARGVETYLLNWTNDEEAIRVAARENAISVKRMKEKMDAFKRKSDVDLILDSLNRQYRRDESLRLAHYVQNSLVSDIRGLYETMNLGVKQALFYVLVGASMPSVLAEVSFISNPREENLLAKEEYRDTIAKAIVSGIRTYFTSQSPVQKVLLEKEKLMEEAALYALQKASFLSQGVSFKR